MSERRWPGIEAAMHLEYPRGIRCRLGLHDWTYFHMAPLFIEAFGKNDPCVSRICERCRMMQAWTAQRKWVHRI